MLTGSCLCGHVAYEVDASPSMIVHCHCQTCRKTHGSAFSTVTTFRAIGFAGPRAKSFCAVSNPRPARRATSARNADRTSLRRAMARRPCCCGWAVLIRRSRNVPRCTSGDRMRPTGTTRKSNWRNGRKAGRQNPDPIASRSCCRAQQQVGPLRLRSLDSRNAPRAFLQ